MDKLSIIMRLIFNIILILPITLFSQIDPYIYKDMLNFEQIDIYDEKPNLEIDASTKRTKFIIQDNDTIRKYIDLEIIDHVDRRIIRTYNEDGTLYEINTIIILSSNKILEIQDFVDYEDFERDSTIKIYNEYDQLLIKHEKGYSNDSLKYNIKTEYKYNTENNLVEIKRLDLDWNSETIESISYNSDGTIKKMTGRNYEGKLVYFKMYERNEWTNNTLYEILIYNSDSLLTSKIIPPTNQLINSNQYIVKRYYKPDKSWGNEAVHTEDFQKIQGDNNDGFKIVIKTFSDQRLENEIIYYYDNLNRLIKIQAEKSFINSKIDSYFQYSSVDND